MNDDAQLQQWLSAHRSAVTGGSPTDHPDIETLTRHATNQLAPGRSRIVSEHLLVCEDARCVAFVRAGAEDVDAAAALLYPVGEAIGMHARTFLCREALWEAFEEFAREQGAPIDEVLSDAMRAYARQRSYGGSTGEDASAHDYRAEDAPDLARTSAVPARQATQRMSPHSPMPQPRPGAVSATRGVAPPHSAPPPARGPSSLPEPPARAGMQRPFTQPLGQALPAPPPRGPGQRFPSGALPLPPPPPSRGMSAPPPRSAPPPLPAPEPYMAPSSPYAPGRGRVATALSLTYQNQTVDVTKDRFTLGRSKSQADLVLDDPNVSRQHAAIERVGDTWVLADLGSTNGCYIDGQRVSRRQLVDGDVIEITTHQVRCTLR